jgi:hypothetical protein
LSHGLPSAKYPAHPHNWLASPCQPSDECGQRGDCRERINTMKTFTIENETVLVQTGQTGR